MESTGPNKVVRFFLRLGACVAVIAALVQGWGAWSSAGGRWRAFQSELLFSRPVPRHAFAASLALVTLAVLLWIGSRRWTRNRAIVIAVTFCVGVGFIGLRKRAERSQDEVQVCLDKLQFGIFFHRADAIECLVGRIEDPRARAAIAQILEVNLEDKQFDPFREVFTTEQHEVRSRVQDRISDREKATTALVAEASDRTLYRSVGGWSRSSSSDDPNPARRAAALNLLLKAVDDPAYQIREATVMALGFLRAEAAVEPLVAQLRNWDGKECSPMRPDPDWESCAAWSLGQIGKPASGPLVALVTQTKSPAVRKEAVRALGAGKDASVVPLLLPLLDRGGEVQGAAAWALGELGDRQAVDALIGALVPWTPNRWRLAEALGKLGDKRAIHAIANSGLVTDWDHGGETIRILGSLGWKAETPADHVHVAVAGRDRPALAADWENTRKTLLADIDTGQTVAVQNALFAFILIGKEEVIPALIDLLNRKRDRERGLRIANGYLQSGNTRLASAARDWAARNDAEIFQTHSTKTQVKWGGR